MTVGGAIGLILLAFSVGRAHACGQGSPLECASPLGEGSPGDANSLLQLPPGAAERAQHQTTLWMRGGGDGMGQTMINIVYGMALAEKLGWAFGGMVHGSHESHHLSISTFVTQLFGTGELLPKATPHFAVTENARQGMDLTTLLEETRTAKKAKDIYLVGTSTQWGRGIPGGVESLLTPSFTSSLRSRWKAALNAQGHIARDDGRARPLIAVHVRRGDVGPNSWRVTDDDWYFSLVDRIREKLPHSEVHVFSSTTTVGHWESKDFDDFRRRGMTVHLNTDPLWDWAQMSTAAVLVVGKSTYSTVPAFLNPHCVVFQPWLHSHPLAGWIAASRDVPAVLSGTGGAGQPTGDDEDAQERLLQKCVDQALT